MKKGSLLDIFPIMVILFITILVSIICYKVWDAVHDVEVFQEDVYANASLNKTEEAILIYDGLTVMIFLILSVVTIVLASQIYTHPAWFFVSLFILIIAFIVAVSISNTYETFSTNEAINYSASKFPKTTFLMEKLPIYVIVMMFSMAVAMYMGYKLA